MKIFEVHAESQVVLVEFPDDITEEETESFCHEICESLISNLETGWGPVPKENINSMLRKHGKCIVYKESE